MPKGDVILLSQNDAQELCRALKRAVQLDQESLKYQKEGTYKEYCFKQICMLNRIVRELQASTLPVLLKIETGAMQEGSTHA